MFSKYKLIVIVLFLISCSNINHYPTESVAANDPNFKLNNGVLKLNNIPFSGFTFDLYSSGKLKSKNNF
jgi:hypothetical protein